MRGIKEKIAENLSYINPVSRRMLLGAVIILSYSSLSPSARCCSRGADSTTGDAYISQRTH